MSLQRPAVGALGQPVVRKRLQVGKVSILVVVQIAAHVADKPQFCEHRKIAEVTLPITLWVVEERFPAAAVLCLGSGCCFEEMAINTTMGSSPRYSTARDNLMLPWLQENNKVVPPATVAFPSKPELHKLPVISSAQCIHKKLPRMLAHRYPIWK